MNISTTSYAYAILIFSLSTLLMNTILSSSRTGITSYSEHLAVSLVRFAHTYTSFASFLSSVIPPCTTFKEVSILHDTYTPFTLRNEQQAIVRTQWLMHMLKQGLLPEKERALSILHTWNASREQTEPKAVVLGVKWGAFPLGIWGDPKIKVHPMNIILLQDVFENHTKTTLTKEVNALTHTIVAQSVVKAHGNIYHTEPELADWLFGEKYLHLYPAKETVLTELLHYVKEWNIPHAVHESNEQVTHIALNPVVYIEDIPCASELERITV